LGGIFAHELGHIIYSKMSDSSFHNGNMYWGEGSASWAAGKYYLQWQGYQNYESAIKDIVSSKRFYDIKNIYSETYDPAKQRDVIYLEWASFIDFLIDKYGFEKFVVLSSLFASVGKELITKDGSPLILGDDDELWKAFCKAGGAKIHFNNELELAYGKVYSKNFYDLKKQRKLKNKIIK